MSFFKKIVPFFFCIFLLGGCYEDTVEITLNFDGSGTIKQKMVFSERFMVAAEENKGSQNIPLANKEEIVKKIGSAIEIKSFKQTDLPDGGVVIEFEGTFRRPEQFFLSDYCREQIKLRIAPVGKSKAAIYCDMKNSDSGPNLTQLYGLVKGLYINRIIHLPWKIEKTNGRIEQSKNTIGWTTDLRNKHGLANTKRFIEGLDQGNGFAIFDASKLKFALPLKSVGSLEKTAADEKDESTESTSFDAKVVWISTKKKMQAENAGKVETSDLELGVEISWDESCNPTGFGRPVLLNLSDDLNKDLVKDPAGYQSRVSPREQQNRKKELIIKAKTPSQNAKKLKQLKGSIEVITDVVKEKVVLQNIQELVGKETTGEPALDKLNFKVKSIQGTKLEIEIDGGSKKITSITMFKNDGSKVKKGGGMGYGDKYTYDFREVISKVNKCELEVIVSENTVTVPFSLEEIPLP